MENLNNRYKFRVWDNKNKSIKRVVRIDMDDGYAVCQTDGEFERIFFDNSFGHELMQYTGLKDKNGKEIYEGDILSIGEQSVVNCNDPDPYLRVVKWEKDRPTLNYFQIDEKSSSGYVFCENNCKYFEVIGNIYENPELIK